MERWLSRTLICFAILTLPQTVKGEMQWEVFKKISKYGEQLILFCQVPGCCSEPAGWNKQGQPIFLNIVKLRYNQTLKYDARFGKDGFFLFIRNVSKEDVNVSYSCSHGFEKSLPKILNSSMVLADSVEIKQNKESSVVVQDEVCKILTSVLLTVVLVIIVAYLSLQLHRCKKRNKQSEDKENLIEKRSDQEQANGNHLESEQSEAEQCMTLSNQEEAKGNRPESKQCEAKQCMTSYDQEGAEDSRPVSDGCLDNPVRKIKVGKRLMHVFKMR